jgi:acyl-coenzyme A synthetase/AMP-(fatty) acid ligase
VVGLPDAVLGQRVFGFVKLADGTRDTVVSEILRRVATRLASYKVPEGLGILDELPRNALSKVDRNRLQIMAQTAAAPSRPQQPDQPPARRVVGNR